MLGWNRHRWLAALLASLSTGLALGLPTGLIPNPLVQMDPATPRWSTTSLAVISVLSGLLLATYLVPIAGTSGRDTRRRAGITSAAGLYVTICPTCTLLTGVALGTSGLATWLQPARPLFAFGAIVLLSTALSRRVRTEGRCRRSTGIGNSAP